MTHNVAAHIHESDPPSQLAAQHAAHKARQARLRQTTSTRSAPIFRQAEISTIEAIPFHPLPIETYWRQMWFGDLVFGEPVIERLAIEDVQRAVAKHFKMSVGVLISACRSTCVTHPRQIGMYLARILTNESSPEIARRFGRSNHTTALHAISKIHKHVAEGGDLAADVRAIEHALGR